MRPSDEETVFNEDDALMLMLGSDDAQEKRPDQLGERLQRRISRAAPKISINIPGLLLLVCANFTLFALFIRVVGSSSKFPEDEKWEYYSPILEHVKLPFRTQQIDARLFPNSSDPLAVFAAPPSRDVDRAWNRASKNMIFGLSRSDLLRLGKDPLTAVKFSPEWNISAANGEELYLGVLDVFHQVHCLDMLRKNLIMNYDHYYGDVYGYRPEAFRETHLRHCTSILMQNIMCHADVSVYTHLWREGNPSPWADFGINRQCRDFEALMRFRDKHDVVESFDKFRFYTNRPPDSVLLPMEDGMAEMYKSADEFRDGEYYKDLPVKGCR